MKNIKLLITIIISIIISVPISLIISFNDFSLSNIFKLNISILLLISIFVFYLFSHFIFKTKQLYDIIYRKRYLISLIVLVIIVLGKLNGSSLGMWNKEIEPNNRIDTTIIGTNRYIRSDEWLVNTPFAISQQYNNYNYFSSLPRTTKTDMFSTIFVPVKDILILTRPFNIGYILGEEYGLSFYWYGRLIALFLVSFEMSMLLTNKKKLLSLAGAFLITGSPLVSWFFSNYIVDLLISGQLCLLLFNKYLETNNNILKVIFSIIIGLSFSWFALTIYPSWQIPLGYMYLMIAIWIFIKNYQNNKNINNYLYLLISIIIIIFFLLRYYFLSKDTLTILLNTIYPGKRLITGGGGLINHFIYPLSIFFGISDYHNPCEVSGVYSLFPIPIIISVIFLIKNKINKENIIILLLTTLSLVLTLFTLIPIPEIIAKITLLSMCPVERVIPIIGIISVYLLVLTVSKIDITNNKTKVIILFFTIILSYLIIRIGSLDRIWYLTSKKLLLSLVLLSLTIFLYINSKSKRNEFILGILLIMIGIINIVTINPINIGTSIYHEKETAKTVKKIVAKNKNAKWISIDSIYLGNYVLANGGRVINSTNIYPNLELWKKLDKEKKYADIYNRYAHVSINLTEEETKFNLIQNDYIEVELNYTELEHLNIKYFITNKELKVIDAYKDKIILLKKHENIYIYEYLYK